MNERKSMKSRQERLSEAILLEKTRQDLLAKSRNADNYKDTSKGKNRYERRLKSQISATVKDYDSIDMDTFFKKDVLKMGIPVIGETDVYLVTITFNGALRVLQSEVKANHNTLDFKTMLRSFLRVFNDGNVYVSCSCPDFKFTQAYWATQNGYNSGTPQNDNGMRIRNANDTKGGGCKHILLVLSNLDWMMKVASVVNNYIKYCRDYMQRNYADIIFPKIYDMPYNKAIQLSIFDDVNPDDSGLLPSDRKTLGDIIKGSQAGRNNQGKWVSGNRYQYEKQQSTQNNGQEDKNQLGLQLGDDKEKTLVANR
jgi:hypothetical protein